MEVNWDATDSLVMSSDMDGLDFNVDNDQPLQLHAVSMCAELSNTMDKINHDLERSIIADILNVNPRYAVMDVKDLPSSNHSLSESSPVSDMTNPISMSDYDVYDFADQVKV